MVLTRRNSATEAAAAAAANVAHENAIATEQLARAQRAPAGGKRRARSPVKADDDDAKRQQLREQLNEQVKEHLISIAHAKIAANAGASPSKGPGPSSAPAPTSGPALPPAHAATSSQPDHAQFRESIAEARMDVKVNDAPNEPGAFAQQLQITDGTVSLIGLAKLCLKHKDYDTLERVLNAVENREGWYLTCLRQLGTDRAHGLQATYEAWRARRNYFWRAEFDHTLYDKALGDAILSALRKDSNHSAQPRAYTYTRPGYDSRSSKDDRRHK